MSLGLRSRFFGVAVATLAVACAAGEYGPHRPIVCSSDDECAPTEVCFPDGCGDPGRDIVIEVVPNASSGQLAQDQAIDQVLPVQDIVATEPSVIQGVIQLETDTGGPVPYAGQVTLVAQGESAMIPGRRRQAQYSFIPEKGAYQVAIPNGVFQIAVTPKEPYYPPLVVTGQHIGPGDAANLDFNFSSISAMQQVRGSLLKTASPDIPVFEAEMQVQAFDVETGERLSQAADASSGSPGVSDGRFYLWVKPRRDQTRVRIVASPKVSNAPAPTKVFEVDLGSSLGELVLGDYGTEITVTGTLIDSRQQPIAQAQVRIEGTVNGGGKYRSASAQTDAEGLFTIKTLPTGARGRLELVAVPPPRSEAGQLRLPVVVPAAGGELSATPYVAPGKVLVTGTLIRPDGMPGTSVSVKAEPVSTVGHFPLPQGVTQTATDATGAFSLLLDPATYRLDFMPSDNLPRVSRFVTVERQVGPYGDGFEPIALPQFALSRGRTVTGVVSSIPRRLTQSPPVPAPGAVVSFFRVISIGGEPSAVLLAEGLADQDGRYQVVLPTR